jgi:cell shape-determining protein MreC
MTEESVFTGLGPAQLHYLKSQYVVSLQVLDQTEQTLKAQLEEVERTRGQLQELMRELDGLIEPQAKRRATQSESRLRARSRKTSSSRS